MLDYEWVHIPSRDPEGTRGRKKGGFTIGWRSSIPSRNVTTQLVGSGEWGSVELSLNGTWIQVVGLYRHNTTEFDELNIQSRSADPPDGGHELAHRKQADVRGDAPRQSGLEKLAHVFGVYEDA